MNTSAMSSNESLSAVKPATPPQKQCTFKLACGLLSCRLVEKLSRPTLDGPRKRYVKERKVYQQCTNDQEKPARDEQKVSSSTPSTPTGSKDSHPNPRNPQGASARVPKTSSTSGKGSADVDTQPSQEARRRGSRRATRTGTGSGPRHTRHRRRAAARASASMSLAR